MIKLIIFDWDDVFSLGSTQGYFNCYHEALKGVGIRLSPEAERERIRAKWGSGYRRQITFLLEEHPELVDRACEIYEQHHDGATFINSLSLVPGSRELLDRLARKYILAIASGVDPKILREHVMPKFKIRPDQFAQIMTIYDIGDLAKAKPHPHIAQEIMKSQAVSPEETILVGDAENDVLMARNAGIEPVVVLTGHLSHEQAEELRVKYILEDVTKLEDVLLDL